MAGNTNPQFPKNGAPQSVLITAANTSSQGGGTIATDIFKAFQADATNGSWVDTLRLFPTATTPTAMTATVARIFISTQQSGATTSANTYLWDEVTLPAVNADNASTAAYAIDVPLGFRLGANQSILVTNHAAPAANTAWRATVIGGDF